jgi:nucleotide-binding universal stress UspA family protein
MSTSRANPILTGYRGPDSSGAVQLGAVLARSLRQPLALASAYRYEPSALSAQALPSSSNEARFDAAQTRVERAERLVREDIEIQEHVVPAEDIPEALTTLAREIDACALVVGRDFDGHVTRELLQHAPCPVAVSPLSVPLPGEEPIRVIGVAYDGSPGARYALTAAMHLGVLTGARVELVAAGADADGTDLAVEAEAAAAEMSEAVETAVRLLPDRPGPALIDVSDTLDLLICGSHGRGRALAAVLGSVSSELVRGAHCAVLVVPPRVRPRATAPLGLTTAAG